MGAGAVSVGAVVVQSRYVLGRVARCGTRSRSTLHITSCSTTRKPNLAEDVVIGRPAGSRRVAVVYRGGVVYPGGRTNVLRKAILGGVGLRPVAEVRARCSNRMQIRHCCGTESHAADTRPSTILERKDNNVLVTARWDGSRGTGLGRWYLCQQWHAQHHQHHQDKQPLTHGGDSSIFDTTRFPKKVSLGRGRNKVSEGNVRKDRKAKLKSQNNTFWPVPFSAQSEAKPSSKVDAGEQREPHNWQKPKIAAGLVRRNDASIVGSRCTTPLVSSGL